MRYLFFVMTLGLFFLWGGEALAQQRPNPCPPGATYCHVREVERESYRVRGGQPPRGGHGGYGGPVIGVPSICIGYCAPRREQPRPQYRQPPHQQYGGYSVAPPPRGCQSGYEPGPTPEGYGCIRVCPPGGIRAYDSFGTPICHFSGRRW